MVLKGNQIRRLRSEYGLTEPELSKILSSILSQKVTSLQICRMERWEKKNSRKRSQLQPIPTLESILLQYLYYRELGLFESGAVNPTSLGESIITKLKKRSNGEAKSVSDKQDEKKLRERLKEIQKSKDELNARLAELQQKQQGGKEK